MTNDNNKNKEQQKVIKLFLPIMPGIEGENSKEKNKEYFEEKPERLVAYNMGCMCQRLDVIIQLLNNQPIREQGKIVKPKMEFRHSKN